MADAEALLQATPLWMAAFGLLALLVLACEIGFYTHRQTDAPLRGDSSTDEGYILAAALGLLSLMIGFTFSLALERYETRRDLVVAEANAIGTAYLRAQLFDAPAAADFTRHLRSYVDTRLVFFASDDDAARLERADVEAAGFQRQLWATTLQLTASDRASPRTAAFVGAVTSMFDLQAARQAARRARVPFEVLASLMLFASITALILGYVLGGANQRHRVVTTLLFVLVTLSITITLDLDRPGSGNIRFSGQPLLDVRAAMAR